MTTLAALQKACAVRPAYLECGLYAASLRRAGREVEADNHAVARRDDAPWSFWDDYWLGCFHAVAGDRSGALSYLRRAVGNGFWSTRFAEHPDLEALRGDPEFEAIVAEVEARSREVSKD